MVKIRLTRIGAKKRPSYRIIAIDERRRRDGRPLQQLGIYDPLLSSQAQQIDIDAIDAWVARGAQMSDTVASLVRRGRKAKAAAAAIEGA